MDVPWLHCTLERGYHSRKAAIKMTAISDDGEHEIGQEERFKASTEETLKTSVFGEGEIGYEMNEQVHSGSLRTGQGHFCCHFLRGRAFTVTSGDRQPRTSLSATRGKTGAEPQLKTGRKGLLEEETGSGAVI